MGFGPDNLYRLGIDPITGNLLDNVDGMDPLDILFEGDEEEETDEIPSNMYGRKSNFGAEKFANINDFESRFDFDDRRKAGLTPEGEVDKERLKVEISNLISDIGRQENQKGFRQEEEEGSEGNFGSRKDRRAKKRNDYENSSSYNSNGESRGFSSGGNGDDEYTQAVSNMMREINKNDNEIRNNNYLNTLQNDNMRGTGKGFQVEEVLAGMGFDSNESEKDVAEFQMYDVDEDEDEEEILESEEVLIVEKKDEIEGDIEEEGEEYSLIGDD